MTQLHLVFCLGLTLLFIMCIHSWTLFFIWGGGAKGNVTSQLLDMSTFTANHFEFIEFLTVQCKSELEAPEILPSVDCSSNDYCGFRFQMCVINLPAFLPVIISAGLHIVLGEPTVWNSHFAGVGRWRWQQKKWPAT